MKKYFSLANFRKKTMGFLRDNEGASAIEYAIIAGLIAVAIIAGVTLIGEQAAEVFTHIGETLKGIEIPEGDEG
jgi:pilus assembly protein Flp/PilA